MKNVSNKPKRKGAGGRTGKNRQVWQHPQAYLALLVLAAVLAVCSSKVDDEIVAPGTNMNANTQVAAGETENAATNLCEVAQRLEIPHLRNGKHDLFVVHTVPRLGVNYAMEHDCQKRASRWTAYQWYDGLSSKDEGWNRKLWKEGERFNGYGGTGDPFQPDPFLPRKSQTTLADHKGNGYDRGHMLGSADRPNSRETNGQTFYLSNIHPQLPAFNQGGIWYRLEEILRRQYDRPEFRDTLYIVKGGTIADGQYTTVPASGGSELLVPDYFYMALLCKKGNGTGRRNAASTENGATGGYKAIAFWMKHEKNTDTNPFGYAISIDQLEELTGIDFFCNLPDNIEQIVEATFTPEEWNLRE